MGGRKTKRPPVNELSPEPEQICFVYCVCQTPPPPEYNFILQIVHLPRIISYSLRLPAERVLKFGWFF